MKQFTQNGVTLVFFQKENEDKYSFAVKGDDELTERLKASVIKKRIKEKDLYFAKRGLFEKIENDLLITKTPNEMDNPIVQLAELCQKRFKANLITRVTGKTGADHNPTVMVEIELPNGNIYSSSGPNQRMAKQKAAEKALSEF